MPDRYGDYELRRGDNDAARRWGGQVRNAVRLEAPVMTGNDEGHNTLRAPWYVRKLQEDLRELGFLLVGTPDGIFGLGTEWAIRHFQAYAKMEHTAREDLRSQEARYVDRLSQVEVAEEHRYDEPVCGVLNARTRLLLQHWLDNHWRCPVVIEAWTVGATGNRVSLHDQGHNLWSFNSGPQGNAQTGPFIYARDFTEYYPFPAGRDRDDFIVLGRRRTYETTSTGPVLDNFSHFWDEAEVTSDNLVGTALGSLTAAQLSTFKVVRAVSEVECYGYFDCVNAYDRGFISYGPCHWVLGFGNNNSTQGDVVVERGELPAYISYLRALDQDAFEDAMEFFGVRAHQAWGANGSTLYGAGQRKYTGTLALQQADDTWAQMPLRQDNYNMMRSWHWFYRFVMAGRTLTGFRRRVWHMARVRIRDIRRSLWNVTGAAPAQTVAAIPDGAAQPGMPPPTRPATIGDVFTSERGMALLLRWHIKSPGGIVSAGRAGQRARNALQNARAAQPQLNWNTPPTDWTGAHEQALITALLAQAAASGDGDLNNTMIQVNAWPNYPYRAGRGYALTANSVTELSTTRGSFNFEAADLPDEVN